MIHTLNVIPLAEKVSELDQDDTPVIKIECAKQTMVTMLREAGALHPDDEITGVRVVTFMAIPMQRNEEVEYGTVKLIMQVVGLGPYYLNLLIPS